MWAGSHNGCGGSAIGSGMHEHVVLFCLLGLVLTAVIILMIAPGAVTWALSLIE
jgi:hypothetical protein